MLEKQTLLKGTLILIIALAVLQVLTPGVVVIDISSLSGWQLDAVLVIQHFYKVTPIALLAGFAWSLFGFLRYNFGDQTLQYETDKLYQTWMWFEGILVIVAAGFPVPLSLAITGIIMAVKSVFNQLKTPPTMATASPS
jgi:hypothetical protein